MSMEGKKITHTHPSAQPSPGTGNLRFHRLHLKQRALLTSAGCAQNETQRLRTASEGLGTSHGLPPAGPPLRTGHHILGHRHTAVEKQTPDHVASHTCCQNSKRKEPSEAVSACSPLPRPALMSESAVTGGLQFPASHSERDGPGQSAPQTGSGRSLPQRGPGAPAPPPTTPNHEVTANSTHHLLTRAE